MRSGHTHAVDGHAQVAAHVLDQYAGWGFHEAGMLLTHAPAVEVDVVACAAARDALIRHLEWPDAAVGMNDFDLEHGCP
jgi:hypothetical protein